MGWGGVPTGAGLVDGGVDQGPRFQERVRQGWSKFRDVCRIFVVSNAYKKKKNAVFEGCPVGWGGAWWTGG